MRHFNTLDKENISSAANLPAGKSILFQKQMPVEANLRNDALWSTRTIHNSSRNASPSVAIPRSDLLFTDHRTPSDSIMAKLNQLDPEQLKVLETLVQQKLQVMLSGP